MAFLLLPLISFVQEALALAIRLQAHSTSRSTTGLES